MPTASDDLALAPAPTDDLTTGGDQPVISLENVAVLYRVPRERVSGMKEYAIRWLQRRIAYEEFWALKDVSFSLRRGEAFGVVGRNGSGKSTLLKVISRVLYPTRGRVAIRGQVAPLLELGGGFHPELTGRENIFLNSALLGHPRGQTRALFDEIVDFAELHDFIDAPIRTYSTGMVARLGFAVATCRRPDILLLDEILSVGDGHFQEKCLQRMFSYKAQGTTVIFVSHSLATVETFCERAMWLEHGHLNAIGAADEVMARYVDADRSAKALAAGAPAEPAPAPVAVTAAPETPVETPASEPAAVTPTAPPRPASIDYISLNEIGKLYPAAHLLNPRQGAVSVWVRFNSALPHKPAIIFHSEDSRYVIYMGSHFSATLQSDVWDIVARAGGNQRAFDTYYGTAFFPETSVSVVSGAPPSHAGEIVKPELPPDEWHLVTMTWSGSPKGELKLYLDDALVNRVRYGPEHDNGLPFASSLAFGLRPLEWVGEVTRDAGGQVVDSRPESSMPVANSGLDIQGLRLYQEAPTPELLAALAADPPLD